MSPEPPDLAALRAPYLAVSRGGEGTGGAERSVRASPARAPASRRPGPPPRRRPHARPPLSRPPASPTVLTRATASPGPAGSSPRSWRERGARADRSRISRARASNAPRATSPARPARAPRSAALRTSRSLVRLSACSGLQARPGRRRRSGEPRSAAARQQDGPWGQRPWCVTSAPRGRPSDSNPPRAPPQAAASAPPRPVSQGSRGPRFPDPALFSISLAGGAFGPAPPAGQGRQGRLAPGSHDDQPTSAWGLVRDSAQRAPSAGPFAVMLPPWNQLTMD
ncbi:uncharacterized protein DKFZp434B061-like [Heterocephalus glaber]|uniref:Uncharacterized protein DKFZp434B061-like n=1 Tax=Heterocephalus glaber TaxID=10181 RepID=A0AAX6S7G7_HETGA|nr:uncharacterized protein DKFZp434B061-like [Heterocephalus glaber]